MSRNAAIMNSSHTAYPSHAHAKPSAIDRAHERLEHMENPLDFFHLFWIFVLVSIVGLFAETIVSYPVDGIWKDRAGLVWGPFSPIFGLGAVLMTLALYRMRTLRSDALFLIASLIGATFELAAGMFWERAFGFCAWDYSSTPFNIGGYTCLPIALCWGAIGVLWIKFLLPITVEVVDIIPLRARKPLTAVCATLMAADIALTLVAFNCWFDRANGNAVDTPVEAYFAQTYSDEFMDNRFQTITMYTDRARR